MENHYDIYVQEYHQDDVCYCELVIGHGDTQVARLLLHKGEAIKVARAITHIINHMDEVWHPDVTPHHPPH